MKKLMLFTMTFLLTNQVFCQFSNDSSKSFQISDCQLKNKKQKNFPWPHFTVLTGNNHRVISFSFKKEKSLVPVIRGLAYRSYPAFNIKINLDNH